MATSPVQPAQSGNAYTALLPAAWRDLREAPGRYQSGFHWTERHLQCIWFNDRLRPTRLTTITGEPVTVESAGHWNLEAGPDFLDAVLRVGTEQRRLVGDVEIHVRPTDWERHHHDRDGLYRRVVLHVTYFAGPPLRQAATPAFLHLPLCEALAALTAFSFDDVDLAAYPHAALPQTPRPCGLALRDVPDTWAPLLAAAGRHRLEQKARALQERLARVGDREQVFYEEVMASLGYKHNAAAFRRLAQRLPLSAWESAASARRHLARLLGAASLLPDLEAAADDEARAFVRGLWDDWWRNPVATSDGVPAPAILRHATRPCNAPARRLAAAASLFQGGVRLAESLLAIPRTDPSRWFKWVASTLQQRLTWDYWSWHLTATGRRQAKPTTLLGESRLAAVAANVVLPLLAAEDTFPAALAEHLPTEDISAPMRETASALFSRDHNPALYATRGLYQQGLMQIHHDFCLNARAGCAQCALAAALQERVTHP